MNFQKKYLLNEKVFYSIVAFFFTLSILNSIYQFHKFNNFKVSLEGIEIHSLINGDIKDFWDEGDKIIEELKNGKNYFETGGEYRRPYLPSRTYAFFSSILNMNLNDHLGKVSLDTKKIYLLFFQSIAFYFLLIILYKKICLIFPKINCQIVILFLSIEPTLFMYHSSFWSESIFFSLQLLLIILILKKNLDFLNLIFIGLILGVFYLQRSVAIFYILPVLIFYFFLKKEKFFKILIFITLGYLSIHFFVGYHNYVRMGQFYSTSTQAKDGFYVYLVPSVLSKKFDISRTEAESKLQNQKQKWIKANNLDIKKENDRLKVYSYQSNQALQIIIKNPLHSIPIILKKTLHFIILDPVTHVYHFHKWNPKDGYYYKSKLHKKWIIPRIIYSFLIYFFCVFGIQSFLKDKKNRLFLIYISLSILYFTAVQSWYGGTRYFSPIIIYLSFFFAHGISFFLDKLRLKKSGI